MDKTIFTVMSTTGSVSEEDIPHLALVRVVAVPNSECNEPMTHLIGFPAPPSFSQCNIELATTGNTKRSIGQFHGWHVNRRIHLRFRFFENGVVDTIIGITMLDEVNITASAGSHQMANKNNADESEHSPHLQKR